MLRTGILVPLLLVLGANIVHGQQAWMAPAIMIAVYNDAKVPETDLAKAEKEAAQVFARAGVNVIWANRSGSSPTRTRFVKEAKGIVCLFLHIVREPLTATGDVFGMAFVDPDAIGEYIDVFYGRIQGFGNETLDTAGVLGHVIAHEIGHLLLGVQSHSRLGIMQPHWYGGELRKASRGNLLFTPEQSEAMRERIREASNTTRVEGAGQ